MSKSSSALGPNMPARPSSRYFTKTQEIPETPKIEEILGIPEIPKNTNLKESNKYLESNKSQQKVNITVCLHAEIAKRTRNVVFHTPGLTLSGAVENALTAWLEQQPAVPDAGPLKLGRPLKKP